MGEIATLDCGNAINNGLLTYEAAFEIDTPSNLQGFYNFGFGDSTLSYGWGNGVLVNKSIRGELKLVNSKDSLAGTELSEDFTGKIVLIYRGGYSYAIKALNAQKAGAIAVIFMNHGIQQDESVNDTLVSNMTGILTGETETTATGLQVKIPIILISKKDRDKIITEIKNGSIIMANIGAKIVKDVNSVISYTGGNGGSYVGQTIASTGVLGLTATLQGGVFAVGVSSVTYQISGVPASAGTAIFKVNLAGKTCEIQLSVRGISYGQNINDIEGNTYKTVYIGTQQWMAENLKVSKYNDGSSIPNITDNTEWSQLTTGAWAYSNNDAANNAKYGNLYNWYAVSPTTNGNKNVCPTGWHVPTDDEWTVLTDYLGGANVAGGKMKEVGTTSWNSPNKDATNTSLFTGLPGGFRNPGGSYFGIGSSGNWWSSSENSTGNAWPRNLSSLNGNASRIYYGDNGSKIYGLSVRCVKDPIALLDCGTITNNGTLTAYSASSGVSSEIVYTGGYGSSYNGHTILSTGVTGLTATLTSGVFEYGTGSLKYVISGTPVSQGKADFVINIGGKTCTLSRNVVLPVGVINTFHCEYAAKNGVLRENSPTVSVNCEIAYEGNGGSHNGQVVSSTGVTGLSATLAPGAFAYGYGQLIYEISGIPTTSGEASFAINIAGKTCTLTLTVYKIGEGPGLDITDVDGNIYKTVVIGTQTWMAENLKTTKYNNGTSIKGDNSTNFNNLTIAAYNNNGSYGNYYNWYILDLATNGNKNVCPTGWHVNTENDLKVLTDYLGGETIAGGKMKEAGTKNWQNPNFEATNISGFTGLPAGSFTGYYLNVLYFGNWWISSGSNTSDPMYFTLNSSSGVLFKGTSGKNIGYSVRCLKD